MNQTPDPFKQLIGSMRDALPSANTVDVLQKKRDMARSEGRFSAAAWHNLCMFRYDMIQEEEKKGPPEDYGHFAETDAFPKARMRLEQLTKKIAGWCIENGVSAERLPDLDLVNAVAKQEGEGMSLVPRRFSPRSMARVVTGFGSEIATRDLVHDSSTGDTLTDLQREIAPTMRAFVNTLQETGLCDASRLEQKDCLRMLRYSISEDVAAGINARAAGVNR